ncbi:uncharacterized protein TRUGW13939_01259 [Talaromyces rugulosus]|uniref:Arrestin-like N-terminal domain-containing protein n=1 Tax=Talaromyces rugulosus TaxID=121627 RepID=A0A7H8QKZ7_TALRU|nr:uncharacterized protein TRUGW13939_01259 [Talaromyces rugulosus]QKX54175.1 hypothetical protein TRUGW13939_01259 [Talaromyces rugulosus]
MDVRIHICNSNADSVSGHVVLACETQVDIATVAIKLSGSAISRVHSRRLSESHQLFGTSEQLFPPNKCASAFTSRSVTLPPGERVFSFSIQFPNSHHLMRNLPPSTGDKSSPEEIKYVLEATVQQDGLIRRTRKATRDVKFYPISTITLPPEGQQVQTKMKRITYHAKGSSCEVSATLLNGSFLFLGQAIPLAVEVTNTNQSSNDIFLLDFQSMLFETTEVRAQGAAESVTRAWMVQTIANLQQPFVPEFRNDETVCVVNNNLWSRHNVPLFLTPAFETCNISRRYKLEIRLGIGFAGNNVRIVEFQFPVYIVSPGLSAGSSTIEMEMQAPEYCEKEVLEKLEFEGL